MARATRRGSVRKSQTACAGAWMANVFSIWKAMSSSGWELTHDPLVVGRSIDVAQRGGGHGHHVRFGAMPLHHPLPAAVPLPLVQLGEQASIIERRWREHAAVVGSHHRCPAR